MLTFLEIRWIKWRWVEVILFVRDPGNGEGGVSYFLERKVWRSLKCEIVYSVGLGWPSIDYVVSGASIFFSSSQAANLPSSLMRSSIDNSIVGWHVCEVQVMMLMLLVRVRVVNSVQTLACTLQRFNFIGSEMWRETRYVRAPTPNSNEIIPHPSIWLSHRVFTSYKGGFLLLTCVHAILYGICYQVPAIARILRNCRAV